MGPSNYRRRIQALLCAGPRYEETNWAAIVRFYDRLLAVMPTPVVTLNRAIAVAETDGPATGLALLDGVGEQLDGYHLLHAARGSMLERLGRPHEAVEAYDRAAALARTNFEASFLGGRRTQLVTDAPGAPDG